MSVPTIEDVPNVSTYLSISISVEHPRCTSTPDVEHRIPRWTSNTTLNIKHIVHRCHIKHRHHVEYWQGTTQRTEVRENVTTERLCERTTRGRQCDTFGGRYSTYYSKSALTSEDIPNVRQDCTRIQQHTTPQGCTIGHRISRLHLKKLCPPLEWTGNYSAKDFAIKDKWKFSTQCMHTPGSSPVAQDIC